MELAEASDETFKWYMSQVYPILLEQARDECDLDQKLWLKSKDIYQTRKVEQFPMINFVKFTIKKFDIM